MLHLLLLHLATDVGPDPKDVKAGWTAFVIFLLMFAAVVGLGFLLARQLRTTKRNRDAGILPSDKSDEIQHAPVAGPGNSVDR